MTRRHIKTLSAYIALQVISTRAILAIDDVFNITNQNATDLKTKADKANMIKQLEKEKGELFVKINAAIDDSVTALNKTDDTEAVTGLKFMQELKSKLDLINGTDFKLTEGEIVQKSMNDSGRRHKLKLDLLELAQLFKRKPKKAEGVFGKLSKHETAGDRLDNRLKVQKNLDEWIRLKELEKKKIRDYKLGLKKLTIVAERCPRFGTKRKSKSDDSRGRRSKGKGRKYPCCRKCCKKSYMGCL